MNFRWLLIISLVSTSVTAAELTLPTLTAQLAQQAQQRTQFTQLKTVAGLSRPLRAFGEVLVVPGQGVLYSLKKPLPARYGIGRDKLILEEAGQQRLLQVSEAPWLRTLGRLLHSVLAGELSALEQDFHCELSSVPGGWQLILTPLHEPLTLALEQVQLTGSAHIDNVQIRDRNGDRTELQFQPAASMPLSVDEQALLERLQ